MTCRGTAVSDLATQATFISRYSRLCSPCPQAIETIGRLRPILKKNQAATDAQGYCFSATASAQLAQD